MSATFTLNFFRSGINFSKWGSFQLPGLLNFGEFKVKNGEVHIFKPKLFLVMSRILHHNLLCYIIHILSVLHFGLLANALK